MKTLWHCIIITAVLAIAPVGHTFHDEPGSYREYELKEERFEIEANITELFYQLTYVPVSVRPRVYQELQDLQQRWNEIIAQLIEIDRNEHPQPPVK